MNKYSLDLIEKRVEEIGELLDSHNNPDDYITDLLDQEIDQIMATLIKEYKIKE